jgi:hypothetical protein
MGFEGGIGITLDKLLYIVFFKFLYFLLLLLIPKELFIFFLRINLSPGFSGLLPAKKLPSLYSIYEP